MLISTNCKYRTCHPMKSSLRESGRVSTMTGLGSGFSGGRDVITTLPIATLAECRLCLLSLFEYSAVTRNRYTRPVNKSVSQSSLILFQVNSPYSKDEKTTKSPTVAREARPFLRYGDY